MRLPSGRSMLLEAMHPLFLIVSVQTRWTVNGACDVHVHVEYARRNRE